MSHGDASHESVDEPTESGQQRESGSGGGTAGTLSGYVRKGARSGALAGVSGGATMLRGLRSIRAGDRARGLRRLAVGAGLLAVAAVQRRSRRDRGERIDIDQSDVVETSPDLEGAVDESGAEPEHASGDEASSVVDTGPDVEDAVGGAGESADQTAEASESAAETDESAEEWAEGIESGSAEEPTAESAEEQTAESEAAEEGDESAAEWAEEVESEAADEPETTEETDESAGERAPIADDRLGAAAFDEHSNEVPAPQRAFNQEFLSLNAEVVWGIRDDDAVVVSQLFDPIQDEEDVQYVASTQITEDRIVTIPDEILDHWESVYDGIGVAGGDDIVFATGGELQDDEQLLVVPAAWADELISEDA